MTPALDYSHLVRLLLSSIQSVDASVYRLLNGLAGNCFLDYIAKFEEGATLFKGGAFLGLYWYFWLRPGSDRERRRGAILAILIGAILPLGLSRTIANLAPFRVRPMYNPLFPHHAYAFSISPVLVDWSAFPSDTATFFVFVYQPKRLLKSVT